MDLSQVRIAIASNALGKSSAGHDIHTKLVAAKAHGFQGIELAFECVEAHASSVRPLNDDSRAAQLQAAAGDIQKMASRLSLEIIALQPFGSYDLLTQEEDIKSRLEEASLWLRLCQTLRSPILQVGILESSGKVNANCGCRCARVSILYKSLSRPTLIELPRTCADSDCWLRNTMLPSHMRLQRGESISISGNRRETSWPWWISKTSDCALIHTT